jgi:hypothetical protein
MKSETIFLLLSVLSFSLLLSSHYLFLTEATRISKIIMPLVLCFKDGGYKLSQETSFEFCKNLDQLRKVKDIDCKLLYRTKEEEEACEALKQAVSAREEDCLDLFLGKKTTSVAENDVEKNCRILEAAIE